MFSTQEPRWFTVATVNWETGSRRYTPWFWGTYWDAHQRAFQNFGVSEPTRHEILYWNGSRAVDVSGVPDAGDGAPSALTLPDFIRRAARKDTGAAEPATEKETAFAAGLGLAALLAAAWWVLR